MYVSNKSMMVDDSLTFNLCSLRAGQSVLSSVHLSIDAPLLVPGTACTLG